MQGRALPIEEVYEAMGRLYLEKAALENDAKRLSVEVKQLTDEVRELKDNEKITEVPEELPDDTADERS